MINIQKSSCFWIKDEQIYKYVKQINYEGLYNIETRGKRWSSILTKNNMYKKCKSAYYIRILTSTNTNYTTINFIYLFKIDDYGYIDMNQNSCKKNT